MKPLTSKLFTPDLLTDPKRFWNRKTPEELAMPFNDDDHDCLLSICEQHRNIALNIQTTLPTLDGWCTAEKAYALAAMVLTMKPKTVVEIGTYAGRSFLPFLWALKENGAGRAIGIDPYDAQVSAAEEYPGNAEWWASVDHGLIEKKFRAIVTRAGVMGFAELIKKKSDDVTPMDCDMLHIDGSHCDTALRDAERFGPKVRVGGIAILDDLQWVGGAVLRAVDTLEQMGFRECYGRTEDNWNVMQRCK